MTAYYNDSDPFCVAWLRELIKAGLIAPGEVDERSIEEVRPDDLRGFTQCHFFAGVGVWSYALRGAGWPDDEPVWTGSCPCPPFSSVGIKKACPRCQGTNPVPHVGRTGYFVCCLCDHEWFADGRHLWPELWRLVSVRRPVTLFGEQVAGEDGKTWLASVRASLEILGYAVGAKDLCSAGFGASDIRQRLFFVADTGDSKREGWGKSKRNKQRRILHASNRSAAGVMGESNRTGSQSRYEASTPNGYGDTAIATSGFGLLEHAAIVGRTQRPSEAGAEPQRESSRTPQQRSSDAGNVGQPQSDGRIRRQNNGDEGRRQCSLRQTSEAEQLAHADSLESSNGGLQRGRRLLQPSENPLAGFWRDAEWIYCRDEKWRPVEPGTFPLATGITNRVGRLRGYGNAINAEVAKAFIKTYMSL